MMDFVHRLSIAFAIFAAGYCVGLWDSHRIVKWALVRLNRRGRDD